MLGGYYLGQHYLGISGWTARGILTAQNAIHSNTADNIALIQQHVIAVDNTTHSLTSDILTLIEHKTLVIASSYHSLSSDLISLIQQHTVVISDSLHGLTSDSIILLQKHTLSVADSQQTHTVDGNLVLDQYLLLNQPDPGVFLVTSPEIWIAQNNILAIDNTMHSLVDTLTRVINWADYNKYSGIYIKDFAENGEMEQAEQQYGVIVADKKTNQDTLAPVTPESGVFLTDYKKFGNYQ